MEQQMILKQQLINDIEQLQPQDLILVQNIVQTLIKHSQYQPTEKTQNYSYLDTRKALANWQSNLSDDIIQAREERI